MVPRCTPSWSATCARSPPTSVSPFSWNTAAAITSMLMFTIPAIPIAITTSDELEAEDAPLLLLARADDAVLGERRVEVDDVRHHRRAEDPDREQDALRALEAGDETLRDLRRIGIGEEDLRGERDHDHADERRDHGLEPTEAARLQREDRERGRRS